MEKDEYMLKIKEKKTIKYVDSNDELALRDFSNAFYDVFMDIYNNDKQVVILCIGTDRVTGDSLGPMIGYKLDRYKFGLFDGVDIYGTLENPVHAKNLKHTIDIIYAKHHDPLIISIDASLGGANSVGHLTIGPGALRPGAGVNKKLPEVGDMFITGIVNLNMGFESIKNTRLGLVMQMADIIFYGMINGFSRVWRLGA